MAKRKRPKDPGVGSLIPSSHDRADLPQGMNSKSGDNGQLSQREGGKCGSITIHPIISFLSLVFAIIMAIIMGSFNIYQYIKNRQLSEELLRRTENLLLLNKIFEEQRQEGRIPSVLIHPLDTPRIGASVSRGSINVTPEGIAAKQFIVTGQIDRITIGKSRWIGTLSGLQFWPQIELKPDIGEGQPFRYIVTIPPNIASGKFVLMEAGSQSNQLFKDQMVGQYHQVGLFWPHLKDAQVIASADFP